MQIERTDFYSVPVQDMERASLYLIDPSALGSKFVPDTAHAALRVADVAQAKGENSEGNQLMLHRRYAD